MSNRRVTRTGKDQDGDITKLCNPGQIWSPRAKAGAISDIENETHSYYVQTGASRADVHVVDGQTGKYLRSDPDSTSSNNLDNLPDC